MSFSMSSPHCAGDYQKYISQYAGKYMGDSAGAGASGYQNYYSQYMDKYGSSGAGSYEQFMSKYAGGYAGKYMPGDRKESSGPVSLAAADASSDQAKGDDKAGGAASNSQGGDYQKYMDYSKYTQDAQGGSQAGSGA